MQKTRFLRNIQRVGNSIFILILVLSLCRGGITKARAESINPPVSAAGETTAVTSLMADSTEILRSFYIKASAQHDWVHAYGWADGTELTLTDDHYPVGSSLTANAGQAPWDPTGPDIVGVFDVGAHYDLEAGDVLTVSGAGHADVTYTVPAGMSQVRWFIGLNGGNDAKQLPAEFSVVDDYNTSHDNIELIVDVEPGDTATATLKDQISADNAPDIVGPVGQGGGGFHTFHGQWLDLSSLSAYDSSFTGQFTPSLLGLDNIPGDGQLGVPINVFPSAIYYNPDLFAAAGLNYPPATYGASYEMPDHSTLLWNWDTLAQVGKLLTLDGSGKNASESGFDPNNIVQYGFSFGWEGNPNMWGSFWQAGSLVTGSGPSSYSAVIPDVWKAAWQWVHDGIWGAQPYIPNGAESGNLDGWNVFASGQVAMVESPSWYMYYADDPSGSTPPFQFGAMPAYGVAVGGRIDVDSLRILKSAHDPDKAFDVLSYLATTGVDKLVVGTPDLSPAYVGIPAVTLKQDPWVAARALDFPLITSWDTLKAGLDYPDVPSAESYMPNFNDAWNRVQKFGDQVSNNPSLSLTDQETILETDLTAIFNGATVPLHPYIEADPTGHWTHAQGWLKDASIHMTITRSGTTPYEAEATVGPADWDANVMVAQFNLWGPRYDLKPGDVITMTDGTTPVSMTISALQVTGVDAGADTVSGTADPADGEVNVWVNNGPGHWVTVDSGGHWTAHFSPYDLKPDMNGGASQSDSNGSTTIADWRVPSPKIQANVNGRSVQAHEWPMGANLTMTVNGGSAHTAIVGPNSWNPDDLFDSLAQFDNVDLKGGDVIQITDETNGTPLKSYTLTGLQVTNIDLGTNTVSGLATPGARVQVCVNIPDNCISRWATAADPGGAWSVNFSSDNHDPKDDSAHHTLKAGDDGWASEFDDAGDQTQIDWRLLNPHIEADPVGHWAHARDWPKDTAIHMTIERPAGTVVYTANATMGQASWNPGDPNDIVAEFNLWDPQYDLQAGDVINMSGGGKSASMIVSALQVTEVHPDPDNTVKGTANAAEGEIHVWIDNGPDHQVTVDSEGKWTANFSSGEITPGMDGGAKQSDSNGNITQTDWHVPNPNIQASPTSNWVHAHDWEKDSTLTLTIHDPANPGSDKQVDATVGPASWDANDIVADFPIPNEIRLQAGFVLTVGPKGGGTPTKTYTITDFQAAPDVLTNTVSGNAAAGARVQVCVNVPDSCIARWATAADPGRDWSVDFSTPHDPKDDPDPYTLKPGDNGWASEYNATGDQTWLDWHILNPHIEADSVGHWVNGRDWPVGTSLHMTIVRSGTPDYSLDATMEASSGDPNDIAARYNLWSPRYDLQPGDFITLSGGGKSVSMTVSALQVTEVNATPTNTIKGTANAAEGEIRVWVDKGPDHPAVVVSGQWTVDFSPYELKPGMNGGAKQSDINGNITQTDWRILNPYIEANPSSHWVHGREWAVGTSVALTIHDTAPGSTDYSDTQTVQHNPDNPGDPNDIAAFFNLNGLYDLRAGQEITLTGAGITRHYTIQSLDVTGYGFGADTVSGTGVPGHQLQVCVNMPGYCVTRYVKVVEGGLGDGTWEANYHNEGVPPDDKQTVDIRPGSNGWVSDKDENGNLTWFDWGTPNPSFHLRANDDKAEAYGWPLGAHLVITIDDPHTPQNPDYNSDPSYPVTVVEDPNKPGQTYAEFNLKNIFDIQPGFVVSMTDGSTPKTMTVSVLSFTSVDIDTDMVYGIASSNQPVNLWACDKSKCASRHVTANGSGSWSADFHHEGSQGDEQNTFNIANNTWIDSEELDPADNNGDRTKYGINVSLPYIEASVDGNWVHARGSWPEGMLYLVIHDPDPLGSGDYSGGATFGQNPNNPGDPNDRLADFVLGNYQLHAGQEMTMSTAPIEPLVARNMGTEASTITTTYTILSLDVTGFDLGNDTISGTAVPGHNLRVCANIPGNCISRYLTLDPSGNQTGPWTANYHDEGVPPDDKDTVDLKPGSNGWVAEYEDNGNQLHYDWHVPNPLFTVIDHGLISGADWRAGNTLTLTVDNDTNPANGILYTDLQTVAPDGSIWFDVEPAFDLEPGQYVTLTDGITTKSTQIVVVHFDTITPSPDIAAGRGPADQPANVYIATDKTKDTRNITIGHDGTWTADFGAMDLNNLQDANVTVFDPDGDGTQVHLFESLETIVVGKGHIDRNNPGPYNFGDEVQSTAVPDPGWSFSGWSGDLSGRVNPTTIIINGEKSVTATFTYKIYLPIIKR